MIMGVNNIGQFLKNMGNEHVRNTQAAKKQQDSSDEAKRVTVKNNQEVQAEESREVSKIEIKPEIKPEIKNVQTKAFFAVTENENVVIRIVDSEGNVLRQIPPEEFLKASEFLKNNHKNLFSVEV